MVIKYNIMLIFINAALQLKKEIISSGTWEKILYDLPNFLKNETENNYKIKTNYEPGLHCPTSISVLLHH